MNNTRTHTQFYAKYFTKLPQMKVREIEMILSEMGAIDLENPEESLGEDNVQ